MNIICCQIKWIGFLIDKLAKFLALGLLSRILGGIFGFIKLAIIVGVVFVFEEKIEIIPKKIKEESVLCDPLLGSVKRLIPELNSNFVLDRIKKK